MKRIARSTVLFMLLFLTVFSVEATSLPVANYHADEHGNVIWEQTEGNVVSAEKPTLYSCGQNREKIFLPSRYDSRENGLETKVKSQGGSNICWAIAATDILEQNLIKQNLPSVDFSQAHLAWFAHRSLVYSSDRTSGDGTLLQNPFTHGGNWIDAVAALSAWVGPASESAFPFDAANLSSMGNYAEDQRYERQAILRSAYCYYSKDNLTSAALSVEQINTIKTAVMNDGAVQLSYYSDAAYYNQSETATAYYQNIYTSTNHAVVVIGWDDTFSADNFLSDCKPSSDGAWLCKNSWGDLWGDGGYFWISYEENSLNQIVGYTADTEYAYGKNYQYDGFGFHGRVYSTDYICFVNVFTADEDCEIAAIGTWFLQNAASYTVDVYTDLASDFVTPVDAKKAASVSGIAEEYGYRILDLKAPVAIQKGEIFSVAVTLTVNENCPMVNAAIENKDNDDYVSYSEPRQSFVQIARDGIWYDTNAEGLNNICLKALTLHEHTSVSVGTICSECGDIVALADMPLFRRLMEFFWRFVDVL